MLSKSFEVESPWGKAHKDSADFDSFERLETRDRHRDTENKRNVVFLVVPLFLYLRVEFTGFCFEFFSNS